MWTWLRECWKNSEEELADSFRDMVALASLMALSWVMLAWGVLLDLG